MSYFLISDEELDCGHSFEEQLRLDIISHYVRLESHLCLEIELAGLGEIAPEIDDSNEWLDLEFETLGSLEQFLSMVQCKGRPSGWKWRISRKRRSLAIPLPDLYITHRNLKRLNAITVADYDAKKRAAIERTGYVDA